MKSKKSLYGILIILAACTLAACAYFSIIRKKNSGPPCFIKGPYVQAVTETSAAIMWEAPDYANALLAISGEGLEFQVGALPAGTNGKLRIARIENLKPGAAYKYTVKSGTLSAGPFEFRTAPHPGAAFRMVVYGDTRDAPSSHKKLVDAILAAKPDFVIHTGDFVNHGADDEGWNKDFFEPAKNLIRYFPLFPVHGNHEEYADEYFNLFRVPEGEGCSSGGKGGPLKQFYTFAWGCARIIVLDSNEDKAAPQLEFLNSSLSRRDRKWNFVAMHEPPYSSGRYRDKLAEYAKYVPYFEGGKADIVFCGHEHFYERLEKDGVVYIIAGGGGAQPFDVEKDGVAHEYSRVRHSGLSFVICDVSPERVSLKALTPDGNVFDECEISK